MPRTRTHPRFCQAVRGDVLVATTVARDYRDQPDTVRLAGRTANDYLGFYEETVNQARLTASEPTQTSTHVPLPELRKDFGMGKPAIAIYELPGDV